MHLYYGMLVALKDTYYVKSNRESGTGRYDIMLEPKEKEGNSFIMEFKVFKEDKEKTIEDTIKNAKKQIEEKRYEEELQEKGFTNITKIVYAFRRKRCKNGSVLTSLILNLIEQTVSKNLQKRRNYFNIK